MLSHVAPLLSEWAHKLLPRDMLLDAAQFLHISKGSIGALSYVTCDAPCTRGQTTDLLDMAVRVLQTVGRSGFLQHVRG